MLPWLRCDRVHRSAAERRLLEIENSKFLGGDIKHTHLVKGLDYALLQKTRSEELAEKEAAAAAAAAESDVAVTKAP